MKCPYCGGDNPSDRTHCDYCGSKLPEPKGMEVDVEKIQESFGRLSDDLDKMHSGKMNVIGSKKKKKIIYSVLTVLFGWTGIQYLLIDNIMMFLIFLISRGLLFIGWFYDVYRVVTGTFPWKEDEEE